MTWRPPKTCQSLVQEAKLENLSIIDSLIVDEL